MAKKGANIAWNLGKKYSKERTDKGNKEYRTGSAITLTNIKIKDILYK